MVHKVNIGLKSGSFMFTVSYTCESLKFLDFLMREIFHAFIKQICRLFNVSSQVLMISNLITVPCTYA